MNTAVILKPQTHHVPVSNSTSEDGCPFRKKATSYGLACVGPNQVGQANGVCQVQTAAKLQLPTVSGS